MTDNSGLGSPIKILNVDTELRQQLRLQNIPKTEEEIRQAARSAALDYSYYKPQKVSGGDGSKGGKSCKITGECWHNLAILKIVRDAQKMEIKSLFVDPFGSPVACVIPSTYRWSEKSKKRNMAVCYSFAEYVESKGYETGAVWFLTLTVRHGKVGTWTSCSRTFDRLREGWEKLSHNMRAYGMEYLFVCEPHESGHPHLHGVVCGADKEDITRLISLWCDKYELGLRKAQKAELVNVRTTLGNTIVNYILKYVLKNVANCEDDMSRSEYVRLLHWAELVYRKRARTFYMTRTARAWIREKYKQVEEKPFAGCNTTLRDCISFDKGGDNT